MFFKKNRKMSSSQRTNRIKMKYLFIIDNIEQDKVMVEHVSMDQMWIDVNTKPKMGKASKVDCSKIMNRPINVPISTSGSI